MVSIIINAFLLYSSSASSVAGHNGKSTFPQIFKIITYKYGQFCPPGLLTENMKLYSKEINFQETNFYRNIAWLSRIYSKCSSK